GGRAEEAVVARAAGDRVRTAQRGVGGEDRFEETDDELDTAVVAEDDVVAVARGNGVPGVAAEHGVVAAPRGDVVRPVGRRAGGVGGDQVERLPDAVAGL